MSNGSGLFGTESAQRPHLVQGGGGVAGEVADLRKDVAKTLAPLTAMTVDEFTNVPIADVDAIKTSFASSASAQDFSGAALDGDVGGGAISPPRNITITTSMHTDIDAVGVVITGFAIDSQGREVPQTDTITLTNGGDTTDVGVVAFSRVTRIQIPAQTGTNGLIQVGFGDVIGLSKPLISRAGAAAVLTEIEAGTVLASDAVTGTFADAATAAPNGTYEPATPPNDTNDYAVYYEYDPTG